MNRLFAFLASLLLIAIYATPAHSAGAKYTLYQKTLASFSSTATTLTSQQKDQVKAAVEANPDAEKFICTGIRYFSQPMSVNIMVRKRAKAACEYAKQLNPELSTWYQNKPTQAKSYAGKVLLTVKSPSGLEETNPDPIEIPPLVWNQGAEYGWSNLVAGDKALFSTGPLPAGWEIVSTEYWACEAQSVDESCLPLTSSHFNGAALLPNSLSGKYPVARLKLRFGGLEYSDRMWTSSGPEIRETPMWGRIPMLVGGRVVGQQVSLDVRDSPQGYKVLNDSSIWACIASSAEAAISDFANLLTNGACDWLGSLSSQPITIRESAVGKYLVGNVTLESNLTGFQYSQTTWLAWLVSPALISSPEPSPEPAPAPEPVPAPAPEPEPVPVLRYQTVQFASGSGSCNTVGNSSEFVSGGAVIPAPDWRGLATWVYSSDFRQSGNGGYSVNGSKQYWARDSFFSSWRNATPDFYFVNSLTWKAPVEITCRWYQ